MSRTSGLRKRIGALTGALGFVLGLMPVALGQTSASAAPAAVSGITLKVVSGADGTTTAPYNTTVTKGQAIDTFKWLINDDSGTGDPTAATEANDQPARDCLPASAKPSPAAAPNTPLAVFNNAGTGNLANCQWPSVHASSGHAAVVASGTEADFPGGSSAALTANLLDGKYLMSVTSGGFKIDGAHFQVASHNVVSLNGEQVLGTDGLPQGQAIVVSLNPLPKKTATIRVHVFNDNASTNGQWDGQTETLVTCSTPAIVAAYVACGGVVDPLVVADPTTDMAGFVAHISDVLAEVTTDVYGNPLCTEYVTDQFGNVLLGNDGSPTPVTFLNGGASGSQLAGTESSCISDHYGDIEIPNMGPNRYAVTVIPPDPKTHNDDKWIETTTLEGGHDWDTWNQEGATGYDTELVVGGERVTPVTFGFVKLSHAEDQFKSAMAGDAVAKAAYYDAGMGSNGSLSGVIRIGRAFIGATGAAPLAGTNISNTNPDAPIEDGVVSISCLTCLATDSTVWVGRSSAADGSFTVTGLATGDYSVALWDESQNNILAVLQYSVTGGANTDMGDVLLSGWFTDIQGSIFVDANENGIRDIGEVGVPDFFTSIRTRGNSLVDQGSGSSTTNDNGEFDLSQGYPLGQFLILEAYNPRYRNTGFTYKTDNDTPHTVLSAQVDLNFLPVIGLSAKIEWGVKPYEQGTNGGIAGTVTYDTTRNELNPRESLQEDYQAGVSGVAMQMWGTNKTAGVLDTYPAGGAAMQYGKTTGGDSCTRNESDLGTDAVLDAGQTCKPLGYYLTESWTRPTGCMALDAQGNRLSTEQSLPDVPAVIDYSHSDPANPDCVEAPMSGVQIGGDGSVDGNYAFGGIIANGSGNPADYDEATGTFSPTLPPADYVVEAVSPLDTTMNDGRHLYDFTDEIAVNIASGDTYVPEKFALDGSAGPADPGFNLVTPNSKIRVDKNSLATGRDAACVGTKQTIPLNDDPSSANPTGLGATNPDFNAIGGSPYAGLARPTCGDKLVTVVDGRSTNPTFYMFTPVPIPTKFYGLINDDLNIQTDRRSIMLGEVAGQGNAPVGIYDELGNWKFTAHSDPNGFYEVLLPSTGTYNCPLPAGPCPNVYRLVGNDPGTLDHPNTDYNPQFRTIATDFQGWPGVVHPVDQAPTHIGITIEGPAAQFGALSLCKLDATNPVIYRIDRPYSIPTVADASHVHTLAGTGFGTAARVTLTSAAGVVTPVATTSITNTAITFTVPALPAGPYQLTVKANGLSTVNGLTFHVLGAGYLQLNDVYEVKPDPTDNPAARVFSPQHDAWDNVTNTAAGFAGVDKQGAAVSGGRAIQRAIEAAHGANGNAAKLVVIYPNTATNYAPHNAFGAYFENLVLHGNVKLQGVGPGTVGVLGTTIDASLFWAATQVVPVGTNQQTADGNYSDDWRTFAAGIAKVSTTDVVEGQAVLAFAERPSQYGGVNAPAVTNLFRAGVDGMTIMGGNQQGFPNNIANPPGAAGNPNGGEGVNVVPGPAQGGAITLDQYIRDFAITNNQIQSNGGTYGAVRIGTPNLPAPGTNNHNERLTVANNRLIANGGTNFAGALGIFAGTDGYKVSGNDFCGNFSAEYGGAITHYGLSPNGTISKNRIYYNQAYDEGGGIMIAGELPSANLVLSPGAGAVTIDGNFIEANLTNDDGGGIRFLMAGTAKFDVVNNVVANNVSTHEGGGIALDDAPNVTVRNNTIVKNLTTATAGTSDGLPAPAGLSTGLNSVLLQGALPAGSPNYSRPVLLNNLFADNRAGTANDATGAITGIGAAGDASAITRWDVGSAGAASTFCDSATVAAVCNSGSTAHLGMTSSVVNSAAIGGALPRSGSLSYETTSFTGDVIPAATDGSSDSQVHFVHPVDFQVDSLRWRVNPNIAHPVIVAVNSPITKLTDYHLTDTSRYSINVGAAAATAPNGAVTAPAFDIDGDGRPSPGPGTAAAGFERGADELSSKADLAITMTDDIAATRTVQSGQVVNFTITVSNLGPNSVAGAPVTDTVPAGFTGATWTCLTAGSGSCAAATGTGNLATTVNLASGSTATFVLKATMANTAVPGARTNTANVAVPAGLTDPDLSNNSATTTFTVVPLVDLTITKTNNRGAVVAKSQTITYTVTVRNNGPAVAANAVITDIIPSQLADPLIGIFPVVWSCAGSTGASCGAPGGAGNVNATVTVPPGGVVTISVPTRVRATAVGGPMVNTATVAPAAGYVDTNPANNTAVDTITVRGVGAVAVAKSVLPVGNVVRGGTVTYTVSVTNTSPTGDTATGVVVTDNVPTAIANPTWTCVAGAGSSCASASGIGNLNQTVNVASGVPVVFTVTGKVSATAAINSTITNTAAITVPSAIYNDTGGSNAATVPNTVRASGDLGVTKTVNRTTVSRGASATNRTVVYTVTVSNAVGADTATAAVLADALPSFGGTWTLACTATAGSACGTTNANPSKTITVAGGGTVTYTMTQIASASATANGNGVRNNTATVTAPNNYIESNTGNNTAIAPDVTVSA